MIPGGNIMGIIARNFGRRDLRETKIQSVKQAS